MSERHRRCTTPGQSAPVEFEPGVRDLSSFHSGHGRVLESDDFEIGVEASSHALRLSASVKVDVPALARPLTLKAPVGEWLEHPEGGPVLLQVMNTTEGAGVASDPEVLRMVESLPLNRLIAMSGSRLDTTGIDRFLVGRPAGHGA